MWSISTVIHRPPCIKLDRIEAPVSPGVRAREGPCLRRRGRGLLRRPRRASRGSRRGLGRGGLPDYVTVAPLDQSLKHSSVLLDNAGLDKLWSLSRVCLMSRICPIHVLFMSRICPCLMFVRTLSRKSNFCPLQIQFLSSNPPFVQYLSSFFCHNSSKMWKTNSGQFLDFFTLPLTTWLPCIRTKLGQTSDLGFSWNGVIMDKDWTSKSRVCPGTVQKKLNNFNF